MFQRQREVAQRITDNVREVLGVLNAVLYRVEPESGDLTALAISSYAGPIAGANVVLPRGTGAAGLAARDGRPVVTPDLLTDSRIVLAPEMRALLEQLPYRAVLSVPLFFGDAVIGVLSVGDRAGRVFDADETRLLHAFAAQAAIALDNERLYAEADRRTREAEELAQAARRLTQSLDLKKLSEWIAESVQRLFNASSACIRLRQPDGSLLAMAWAGDSHAGFQPGNVLPPGIGVVGRAVAEGRAIWTRDLLNEPAVALTEELRGRIAASVSRALLAVPLQVKGEIIGAITVSDRTGRVFREDEIQLAQAFSDQVALAIENARLYEETQQRLRQTETLLAVSHAVGSTLDLTEVARRTIREIVRALGADTGGAWLLSSSQDRLLPFVGYHAPKELVETLSRTPIDLGYRFIEEVIRTKGPIYASDSQADPRFDHPFLRLLPHKSVLVLPMTVKGEIVGGLAIVWVREAHRFSDEELRLAEGIAQQAAVAVDNARLLEAEREARERLAVSEARYRELVENVNDIVYEHDLEGKLLSINEAAERISGYTREELLGMNVAQFLAPADLARMGELIARVRAGERAPATFTAEFIGRGGVRAALECNPRTVFKDGVPVAIRGVARDITVRRKLEERQKSLVALSRDLATEIDLDRLLPRIAEQARQLMGTQAALLLLQRGDDLVFQGAAAVEEALTAIGRLRVNEYLTGVVIGAGRTLVCPDLSDDPVWRETPIVQQFGYRAMLAVPLTFKGRALGMLTLLDRVPRPFPPEEVKVLGALADQAAIAIENARLFRENQRKLEELAAAQEQLVRTEKLRALGDMASGVAHHFNNLLTPILGWTELLLQQVENPTLRQRLQRVRLAALDGARTVRRIQEFTRIRRDEPFVAVDLNQVIRQALEVTQPRWREESQRRGVTIQAVTTLAPLPPVFGDPVELGEAFINLILNAVDAMPQGGTLSLTTEAVADRVVVTVRDSGAGMSEEVQRRLFDPFFTTKGSQGTGLGLSLTYGIVSRHGGKIAVESKEGRGSTFQLSFPVSPAVPREPERPAPLRGAASLRCLLVDDEEPVREVLGEVLRAGGHEVVPVADGTEAVARFRAERFDLVITDLDMPGLDGLEVARAIKDHDPNVPVFVVTGWGVEYSPEELRAHGVDRILTKPLELDDILSAVAEYRPLGSGAVARENP